MQYLYKYNLLKKYSHWQLVLYPFRYSFATSATRSLV